MRTVLLVLFLLGCSLSQRVSVTQFKSSSANYATGSEITVQVPPGVTRGDFMIVFMAVMAPIDNSVISPDEWTRQTERGTPDGVVLRVYYKFVIGPEPDSLSWLLLESAPYTIGLMVFSVVNPNGPIGGSSVETVIDGATVVAPSAGQIPTTAAVQIIYFNAKAIRGGVQGHLNYTAAPLTFKRFDSFCIGGAAQGAVAIEGATETWFGNGHPARTATVNGVNWDPQWSTGTGITLWLSPGIPPTSVGVTQPTISYQDTTDFFTTGLVTTGRIASAAINANDGASDTGLAISVGALSGLVIGIFLLIIIIGGLTILACKMTGKMDASSGKKHRRQSRGAEDDLGIDLELQPPPIKGAHMEVEATADAGVFVIPYAALDFNDEIKDTAFARSYKGAWQGKTVLIKKLHTENMDDDEIRSAMAEATLIIRARPHKHVVKFVGGAESGKNVCIVSEYLPNGNILDILKGDSMLHVTFKMQILKETAQAMYHLHDQKILHKNLGARNLLLDEKRQVKVADFGMSNFREKALPGTYTPETVRWMPPEYLSKKEFFPGSDVWSYGVVMFEVFSYGEVPYTEMNAKTVAAEVVKGHRLPIPSGTPGVVRDLFQDCFSDVPFARPTFRNIVKNHFR